MPAARNIIVIGAGSSAGAPDPGCAAGPDLLRHYRVFHDTPVQHVVWARILRAPRTARDTAIATVATVAAMSAQIAAAVEQVIAGGNFPLVVGGDHSCAIGTWSGVHRALADHGSTGLVWIDAHMDAHTFATTESGQIHGMPLAALLGHGDAALTGGTAKLAPEHVCLIGVRSFEAGEAALLRRLGVRVFDMAEVQARGLVAVFDEALAIVRRGTAGFGISIDLDVLDPAEEPGVSTPVPGGLHLGELSDALTQVRGDPAFVALEIVEYNPCRDRDHVTAKAAGALLDAVAPLPPRR